MGRSDIYEGLKRGRKKGSEGSKEERKALVDRTPAVEDEQRRRHQHHIETPTHLLG